VFFSHNKSANNIFSHDFLDQVAQQAGRKNTAYKKNEWSKERSIKPLFHANLLNSKPVPLLLTTRGPSSEAAP
jgi:hypothetical protein